MFLFSYISCEICLKIYSQEVPDGAGLLSGAGVITGTNTGADLNYLDREGVTICMLHICIYEVSM